MKRPDIVDGLSGLPCSRAGLLRAAIDAGILDAAKELGIGWLELSALIAEFRRPRTAQPTPEPSNKGTP